MTRPIDNTVKYFPHDTQTKRTIRFLESKYEHGYKAWFKTLELLGHTENHFLDLNDDYEWLGYTSYLGIDEATCLELLNDFARLKAIDRELWFNSKIVWSQNFVDNLKSVYDNRRRNTPHKPDNYTGEQLPVRITTSSNPRSKVEEVNKTNIPFALFWETYKHHKEKPRSERCWNALSNKARTEIMAYIPEYVKRTNTDGSFPSRLNPATLLNKKNKRWLDTLPEASGRQAPDVDKKYYYAECPDCQKKIIVDTLDAYKTCPKCELRPKMNIFIMTTDQEKKHLTSKK